MISFGWKPLESAAGLVAVISTLASGAAGAAPKRPAAVPPVFPLVLAQQVTLAGLPLGAPSLGGGLAVVVMPDGDVVALDLATGAETWRADLKATQRALVDGDAVYVVTRDSTECLALADGAVRWRTPRAHPATAPPLVTATSVAVATAQPGVDTVARATGAVEWSRPLASPVIRPLLATPGRIVGITERHEVVSIDATSGTSQWSVSFAAPLADLAEAANRIYVGSDDNFFYALEGTTGRIKWKWRTGADVVGSAVVDEHHVYVVSLDNLLRALDRNSGTQRWKRSLPSQSVAGPLLLDRVLLVVGYSPDIRGHHPETGAAAGRYGTDGEIAFQPAVVRGGWPGADRLAVVTLDASLLVLRRRLDPPTAPLDALPGSPVTVSDPPAPEPAAPPPLP